MHTAHHLRVTTRKVVIDSHNVHTLAFQGIQVGRKQGGQRLTFTSAHLSNVAKVQGRATHDLHLVVLLVHHAPRSFAHGGECLKKDVVESFSVG